MEIRTRSEARSLGEKSFFTGVPCPRGHLGLRGVANGACLQCQRDDAREWRGKNLERARATSNAWYASNKQHAKEWKQNWLKNNKELYKNRRKNYRMKTSTRAKELWNSTRWASRKRGFPHDIDIQWISEKLDAGVCELTGIPFNLEPLDGGRSNPYTASIDRIDPSLGYVVGNVRMILWALNAGFNSYGEDVYAEIAKVYLSRKGYAVTEPT